MVAETRVGLARTSHNRRSRYIYVTERERKRQRQRSPRTGCDRPSGRVICPSIAGCDRVTAAADQSLGLAIVTALHAVFRLEGSTILRLGSGAQRASGSSNGRLRLIMPLATALLCAVSVQLAPSSFVSHPALADSAPVPKAVFIVGPTGSLTDTDLKDAERMAVQAETAGMEVHRVFFPHATWENVLANIQDANLVVYMGHGYGWPSPYTSELTETRQDGMGLNTYDGSGKDQYTYYGAMRLRENIHLAPNAIVYLDHLCYSAGNAEPGMAIPNEDLARQRVDNMASGWLATGARAVFAYGWWQRLNFPNALMTTDQTMDAMFMTPATGASAGSPAAYTAWAGHEARFDSERTPGATNHLDPHPRYGYYRAVTGDLGMTAAEFRSTATGSLGGGSNPNDPPEITSLSASDGGSGATVAAADPVSFHPNGDGIDETLVLTHSVTRPATLDASITDSQGNVVRTYSVASPAGRSASSWNGKDSAGRIVPDGRYTLTYTPHDAAGLTGDAVSIDALVLTAVSLATPSSPAFFAADADGLSKTVTLKITLKQAAEVTWQIVGEDGAPIRTVRSGSSLPAGTVAFKWDGKTDAATWAPDGWYRSVVSATTGAGTYTQERRVFLGAFRLTPSISSPARGGKLTLTIASTESLSRAPTVHVSQPGLAGWNAVATVVSGKKYKVTLTLDPGGDAGTIAISVTGTDKEGGSQESSVSLPLR
jgi:flagellar hook assembly protein FlgD